MYNIYALSKDIYFINLIKIRSLTCFPDMSHLGRQRKHHYGLHTSDPTYLTIDLAIVRP